MIERLDIFISIAVFVLGQVGFSTIIFYAFTAKVKEIVKKELHEHEKEITKLESVDSIQNDKLNDLDKRISILEINQGHVASALMDLKKSIDDTFSKINDIWKYLMKDKG